MSYSLVVFAVPPMGGYLPGGTLDPDCAPLDPDCSVAVETLTFDSPLTKTGSVISLPEASATVDGYLSATDYNAFDNKEDSFGAGTSTDYLRGDKTWVTLDTSVVPENGNLYWTNNRFDTRLAATTSIPNLQTVGTITSGVWHGSQITDAYVSDSITASNYIPLSQKGAANGVATLDGSGKITASQLSSFSLSDTFVVNSEAEMLNLLSAELGDVAIRLDENKSYILTTNDPTNVANWQLIITPLDFILSVNGQTGAVSLTTTDIPEGLNLYYTDTRVDDYLNTVKGVANGIASLDANGKIPTNQLGSIILNETHVVVDIPAMLALTSVANGDLAVVTSTSQTYVLADDNDPSNINSWVEIVNGSPVTSVNGQVGTVNLTTTNISEGSNQYFTNTRARNALSATGPLSYNATTGVFGITQANAITNGFLSATDWNTFNNKQSALTFGNVTASSNPEITITGGTGAIIGAGLDIIIPDASDTVRGLITTGAQDFGGVKNFTDGLGIGDASPSTLFSVGSGGLFQVNASGNIVKINNVVYSWPATQGAADSVLVNNGSGGLSWASNGVTSLNGLTDTIQTFTTSTTGTDFSISSSAGVHTFNFPTASATARGALSTTKYTEFNNKPFVNTTDNNITTPAISGGGSLTPTVGINNVIFGYQAGDTMTTGANNTLIGYQSGKSLVGGVSYSFFAGYQTGLSATGATNSNFIGRSAGSGATFASFANFFGRSAGLSATGAQYGVFIGDNAGNTASGSSNATFIGQNAGYQATTAPYSTFIGTSAGYQATGATTANFIGYAAGYTASDADYANFIGRGAGNAAANAQYSNFFGFQSGYNATNAANSIFIGKNAGNGDLVNNTVSGSSIAIGDSAGTGGFSNSIAIGASAVNTATNQFLIGSTYTNFNVRGINYVWPSAQAAGSGYTLSNDGSGNLSWTTGLAIGGTSGQLQYNNAGSLAGVSGITYNGANLDANDATFRIVNWGDTTKRAIFDAGYIDPGTTRTYSFPNAAGTLALTSDLTGYLSRTGGTMTGSLILAAGTTSFAPLKLQSGTNLTTAEAGAFEYNGSSLMFTRSGTLRAGVLMTDIASPYNTYDVASKGATAFTSGTDNFLAGSGAGSGMTTASNSIAIGNGALTGAGANYSIALGKSAGNGTAVSSSFFAGLNAGSSATGANYSNFFGENAGSGATAAANSNFFGYYAGSSASGASYANFFGWGAGTSATNAVDTVGIGQNAARNATGSIESIFIGKNAGYNSVSTGITGDYNIGLGTETGKSLTTGAHNTFLGYQSGRNVTAGTGNFMVGYQAGYNGGDSYNNFLGYTAGYGATTVQQSNFIGPNTGTNAIFASYSNFLGPNAGYGATYGSYSNFLGQAAGLNATNATASNFIGGNAGSGATNAANSNFLGNLSGYGAIGAVDSIFIGQNSGRNATDSVESIFLGKNAGYNSTSTGVTGDYNIGLGSSSGLAITTGSYNVMLGYQTSNALTTGSKNVGIGYDLDFASNTADGQLTIQNIIFGTGNTGTGTTASTGNIGIGVAAPSARFMLPAGTATASTAPLKFTAGTNLTTIEAGAVEFTTGNFFFSPSTTNRIRIGYGGSGSSGATNLAVGVTSGTNLTTGSAANTYFGTSAGAGQTSGIGNTGVGSGALGTHTGYTGNVGIGEGAMYYGSGSINVAIGDYAMFSDSSVNTSNYGIAIGGNAFYKKSSGDGGIAIGYNAGLTVSSAAKSIIIGYNAVNGGVHTGTNTIAIGEEAGKILTSGAYNTLIGYQSGATVTTGTMNNFMGYQAGYNTNSGTSYANFIGYQAGYGSSASGSVSNFIGYKAGYNTGYSIQNNFIGNEAGYGANNLADAVFIGTSAGYTATTANRAVFIGKSAGVVATNAADSVFIGTSAGQNATGAIESIFIGKNAGYNAVSTGVTGDYNIGLGSGSGLALTTGAYNTLIGWQAGDTITTGSNNVIIGKDIDAQSATTDNQLSIQNIIFGTGNSGTGTTVSTGKIGIGISPATYRFEVSDTSTGAAISSFTNSDGTCTLDPGDVTGWSCPSDLNLKKDITTLESGSLDQLLALRPVNYRLRNEDGSAVLSTGLIAQEVQGVFPKLVKIQADGTLALNYGGLTPYIIKAIQEMNLQITEINDIEKPNSWRDALVAWFANTANGITEFFSKKVSTEELCVKDSTGQTCITRTQLDALLNGQGIVPPPSDPEPDPTPTPDPTSDPITCTAPEVLNSDGTACEAPPSGDPAPDPNPTPEPDPVPPSADNPDPGTTE